MKILNKNNTPESIYSTYTERKAVRTIVTQNNEILLIHSTMFDTYTLPGGGVEPGETLEEAAIREVQEETGLQVTIENSIANVTEVFDKPKILNVTSAFVTQITGEIELNPEPDSTEEGQELVWVPLKDAIKLIQTEYEKSLHTSMARDMYFIEEYLIFIENP